MSDNSVLPATRKLREASLDLVWRQWRAIGATLGGAGPVQSIVDPEALLLMSLSLADHERRLTDVVWSWTSLNSALLSIQRLGNLRKHFPPATISQLGALAAYRVEDGKDARWKSLRESHAAGLRSRTSKTRAATPRFESWATLLLQLRLGLGVGVKADLLAFVLGANDTWVSVSAIARATGYTLAAVRRAADDLAASHFLRPLEKSADAQRMFTGNAHAWSAILRVAPQQPGWVYWREQFTFVIEVLAELDRWSTTTRNPYARDVAARELIDRHRSLLRHDRFEGANSPVGELGFDELVAAAEHTAGWMLANG